MDFKTLAYSEKKTLKLTDQETKELLEAIYERDELAEIVFMKAFYNGAVYAACPVLNWNKEEARDEANIAISKVINKIREKGPDYFKNPKQIRSYIRTTAHNSSVDYLKCKNTTEYKVISVPHTAEDGLMGADSLADPCVPFDEDIDTLVMASCGLELLTDLECKILLLRQNGVIFETIANMLGMNVSKVKRICKSGQAKMCFYRDESVKVA